LTKRFLTLILDRLRGEGGAHPVRLRLDGENWRMPFKVDTTLPGGARGWPAAMATRVKQACSHPS